MKNGEISNKVAPYVLFDIDSLMFREEESKPFGKLLNMFKSAEKRKLQRKVSKEFVDTVTRVWNKHNVCIGLFTFDIGSYREELEEVLFDNNIPYTRVFLLEEWEDLRYLPNIYTFSNDDTLLSYLSSKRAKRYEDIWEVL